MRFFEFTYEIDFQVMLRVLIAKVSYSAALENEILFIQGLFGFGFPILREPLFILIINF